MNPMEELGDFLEGLRELREEFDADLAVLDRKERQIVSKLRAREELDEVKKMKKRISDRLKI